MVSPWGISYSPYDIRCRLRERLRRCLTTHDWRADQRRQREAVTDEAILHLLMDLEIEFQRDVENFRAAYDACSKRYPDAAGFNDLIRLGYLRVVWERVGWALGTPRDLSCIDEATRAALGAALPSREQRRFAVGPSASQIASLAPVLVEMQDAPQDVHHLPCPTPSWVIARLWERAPEQLSPVARLRFWVDRCDLLRDCYFAPLATWDDRTAETFREAAFEVLTSDAGLLEWDALWQHLVARSFAFSGREESEIESYVGRIPATHLDRYLWLNSPHWDRVNDGLETCGDLWRLVNFLLAEIQETAHSEAPHPVASRLFELASERPELLEFITLRTRDLPLVLADMLLDPRLSALACLLIVDRTSGVRAGSQESRGRYDRALRASAFADALAVVVDSVGMRSVAPAELAALLSWLHAQAGTRQHLSHQEALVDNQLLQLARSELIRLPAELLQSVAESCITSERPTGVGSPSLIAALDVASIGTLTDALTPELFVNRYLTSLRSGSYSVSAAGISPAGAAALVRLAQRAAPECWREFLSPLNIRALLAKGYEPGANRFTVRNEVARSLRAHLRILCRAIGSWHDAPPPELVDAVIRAVRSGAVGHDEKGRVAAFSAQYESDPFRSQREQPLSSELGECLVCLDAPHREQLLSAVLETDEPLMLAQLITVAPHSLRERIRERILELTPAEAGELHSLTDVQARIEALLEAGIAEAAASFIGAERELRTWGRVPGRELTQLRTQLRLWLRQGDFASISSAEAPAGLNKSGEDEAKRILAFYKALAELRKPAGDLDAAERAFERLRLDHPEVPAYATNLLAARVSRLLPTNLFARLRGAEAARARQALAEAESAMARWVSANDEDVAAHNCNRVILLLAIGQPEHAHEVLQGTRASKLRERVAAYSAVALARMGRATDASHVLSEARHLYGESDDLRSARAQIRNAQPLEQRPSTLLVDEPLARMREALFTLQQMDAARQADVLCGSPDALGVMVTSHVRNAASAVMALVPMLKDVRIDSCEDDLTALLQAILSARLEFFGWSLADQSKGGFTGKGNPGERDLVLRKGNLTLSILEAVVCTRPAKHAWTKKELTAHFQKLFGYSTCPLFFHLTYSYVADPKALLTELRRIAAEDCPPAFFYQGVDDLPFTDSAPNGFSANYDSAFGRVKVVFLLLDMGQKAQRDAARAASRSNPRRRKDAD